MRKYLHIFFVAVCFLLMLLLVSCGNDTKSSSEYIMEMLNDSVTIESLENIQTDGTADVTFSMLDIEKVYQALSARNKNVSEKSIKRFIKRNKTNPDYLTNHTVTALIGDSEHGWAFASDDTVLSILREQANNLMANHLSQGDAIVVKPFETEREDGI